MTEEECKQARISARNKHRIHLRPIQQIVEVTSAFKSEIVLSIPDTEVSCNAKSMLDLIVFAADLVNSNCDELAAEAKGEDAEQALTALVDVMNKVLSTE